MVPQPQCQVCLDVLALNECSATRCGHTFHLRCIVRWFKNSRVCPVCRKEVTPTDLIPQLFFQVEDDQNSSSDDSHLLQIHFEIQKVLDNLEKEKRDAATAKNKANFYLAANLLLKERISDLESAFHDDMQKIRHLENIVIKQQKINNELQKRLKINTLQMKQATETAEKQEEKSQKILKTINELTKNFSEHLSLSARLRENLAFPSETVMDATLDEVIVFGFDERAAKNDAQANIKNNMEEVSVPPII
ncbi:Ring finger domain family protein [Acanthocheilonema viteae]